MDYGDFGMTERFEIFPQNVAKDGTLIIIQKGLKLYNISDVVELLNELNDENDAFKNSDNITELETEIMKLKEENKELRSDRNYWKTLAQSLAKTNGNIELKDEHIGWKRVDVG